MPVSSLLRSARVPALTALCFSLFATAPAVAGSLPRALTFRGEMVVETLDEEEERSHRGVLQIRGEFRADRCRITLKGRNLPAPASGEFELFLFADDAEALAAQFAPDENGRVAYEGDFEVPYGEEGGDARRFGMNLNAALLVDGEVALAESALGCAVKVSVRGRMESDGAPARAALSLYGDASRAASGRSEYRFLVTLRGLDAGVYVLLMSGEGGEFALEFEIPERRRSSRMLRFAGDDDLVEALLGFGEMALFRIGEDEETWNEVMSGPLDCR